VRLVHRYGQLQRHDQIVLVGVAAGHRKDAFAACEFIMDYLKQDVPFWKAEITAEGEKRWVDAKQSDQQADKRWR
jgi:molybdopterin synthase catalytic subunit